jgi:hypothetical protein
MPFNSSSLAKVFNPSKSVILTPISELKDFTLLESARQIFNPSKGVI